MSLLRVVVSRWLLLPWWLRSLLPLAITIALWWLSSASPGHQPVSSWTNWLNNAAHVVAYAMLSAAIYISAPERCLVMPSWRRLSIVLAAIYGFIDELHQSQVPGRFCSVLDWCSDVLGSMLGVILVVQVWDQGGQLMRVLVVIVLSVISVAMATLLPW
jgi:VanZ family protein